VQFCSRGSAHTRPEQNRVRVQARVSIFTRRCTRNPKTGRNFGPTGQPNHFAPIQSYVYKPPTLVSNPKHSRQSQTAQTPMVKAVVGRLAPLLSGVGTPVDGRDHVGSSVYPGWAWPRGLSSSQPVSCSRAALWHGSSPLHPAGPRRRPALHSRAALRQQGGNR
jgi:hypothetical protein